MKMIVIEGHDNSGKSTLAARVAELFGLEFKESEGPPKSPTEINERCARYAELAKNKPIILVRHPCISNAIYAKFRQEGDVVTQESRDAFYANKDVLIIYADRGDRGLGGHKLEAHDTPEHMALVEANDQTILDLYREWALKHAQVLYRIGDDYEHVFRSVGSFLYSTGMVNELRKCAVALRIAQKEYMQNRGNTAYGKAVADAARNLDYILDAL